MVGSTLPRRVLIIRHGEKPGDPCTDDSSDGPNLSSRGYQRAAALAAYVPAQFGNPDFLIATRASSSSNRPVETITPLSKATVAIDDKHPDNDYDKVAADILSNPKYAGKQVLICWHHGKIPKLTVSLRGQPPVSEWPCDVFDRVWQITYPTDGSTAIVPVLNLPQKLLPGDSVT
jgi:phosphohistidine phosphatase SixA